MPIFLILIGLGAAARFRRSGVRSLRDLYSRAYLVETLGLTWQDVDTEAMTITITHQLRDGKRVALKTKRSRRCLEVTPGLIVKLGAHKIASPRSADHDPRVCEPSRHRA